MKIYMKTILGPLLNLAIVLASSLAPGGTARSLTTQSKPELDGTSLVEKARKGDLQAVQGLLSGGLNPNAKSQDAETALAAAAGSYRDCYEVFDLLLGKGAIVDQRSLEDSAIFVDIAFGFHENPMPSYSFRCGNSIFPMAETYSKSDKIGVT